MEQQHQNWYAEKFTIFFCNLHISNVTTAATVDSRLAMYKKCFLRLVVISRSHYVVLRASSAARFINTIRLHSKKKTRRFMIWHSIKHVPNNKRMKTHSESSLAASHLWSSARLETAISLSVCTNVTDFFAFVSLHSPFAMIRYICEAQTNQKIIKNLLVLDAQLKIIEFWAWKTKNITEIRSYPPQLLAINFAHINIEHHT